MRYDNDEGAAYHRACEICGTTVCAEEDTGRHYDRAFRLDTCESVDCMLSAMTANGDCAGCMHALREDLDFCWECDGPSQPMTTDTPSASTIIIDIEKMGLS